MLELSYIFVYLKANELMIGGRKITAIEACQLGLVSQVYWPTSMMQEVIPRIQLMAQSSGKVGINPGKVEWEHMGP